MLRLMTLASISSLLACASACSESPRPVIASELVTALESGADAEVIIQLREPSELDRMQRAAAIERLTSQVRSSLVDTLQVSYAYHHLAALAGRIKPAALPLLQRDPNIAYVQRVRWFSGQLNEAVPALGVDRVRSTFGLRGRGVRVAVMDSGIDREHPDFEGAVVAERCFARGACPPWNLDQGDTAT